MKLFIYEHITSGALIDQPLPPSLAHEGDAMLRAVLSDCRALPDVSIKLMRDQRLALPFVEKNDGSIECQSISSIAEYNKSWHYNLEHNDAVIVIAPETDGILQQLQQETKDYKIKNLGCSVEAIAVTGDKLECYKCLTGNGVATPETCLASDWQPEKLMSNSGYIVKPLDGAGCIDTLFFSSITELNCYLDSCSDNKLANTVIQPYISGCNVSLCLLFCQNNVVVLSLNEQKIELNQQSLKLISCHVNGYQNPTFSFQQALQLTKQIHQAIPGLYGFVGVDLIISDSDISIVDINPRLTSSYIGLAESLFINPMNLLLPLAEDAMLAFPQITQARVINVKL